MSQESDVFSISIEPRQGQSYKSISTLRWDSIPSFAIITGKNGSGKTQLLELLAYHLAGARPLGMHRDAELPVSVSVSGLNCDHGEVGFVPSSGLFSGGGAASLASMQQAKQQQVMFAQHRDGYIHDVNQLVKSKRLFERMGRKYVNANDPSEVDRALPDDFDFMLHDLDVTSGLSYVFVAFRLKYLESLERGNPGFHPDGKPLGPAPWDIVNEALETAGFPYSILPPTGTAILGSYELTLKDAIRGTLIRSLDLSSGEKVILQLILWLYTSGKDGLFPKLILLDEPDAHLHPSMTNQFINVVNEVLVRRHKVVVIMTTHSPSTVALAPEGSVFHLRRGSSQIDVIKNRSEAINELTAGIISVHKTTKFCFVEDESDVEFYKAVSDISNEPTNDDGSTKLGKSPPIAFLPASIGEGSSKVPGGSTVVRKWVGRLDAEPLNHTFVGVIDKDTSNLSSDRIYVLGRYSIENYLIDPFTILSLLVDLRTHVCVIDLEIQIGQEGMIKSIPLPQIQQTFNRISAKMEAQSPTLSRNKSEQKITYSNGLTLTVPKWLIDHRGHDLLVCAQMAFGHARTINPPSLLRAMRRGRVIPTDLSALLSSIQAL